MNFTNVQLEEVLEYWQDISQDPEFISKETGISISIVLDILEVLQNRGDINNFSRIEKRKDVSERKVLLFEEHISPEIKSQLRLDQLSKKLNDQDYFFEEKEINETYDAHLFEVKAVKAVYDTGFIIIPLEVTVNNKKYDMFMVYSSEEEVYYGGKEGEKSVDLVRKAIGKNWDLFDVITQEILDDHIPDDFWEVRNLQN